MMLPKTQNAVLWLGALALGLSMSACGTGATTPSAATGVAQGESPITGTVSLVDSSAPAKQRSAATRADGSFALDLSGLTPPFLIRVEWTEQAAQRRLYAVVEGAENIDVNPITELAYRAAASGDDEEQVFHGSSSEEKRGSLTRAQALLTRLAAVLAPLFDRYGIHDPRTDKLAVRALLQDVRIQADDGVVTVTNRATGKVIFTGPLAHLDQGTFFPENMPAGQGTPPPPPATCTSFTYSAWGACQPGNTQTRAVLTSLPAGCTGGSPVTSQACTYVPPANTCTSFTYSVWSACQPNNTQTRSVLASMPAGCTGGSPVLSQSCTYVPPIDGAALYTQYCSGCHGNSKKGSTASAIQNAINSNRGGMGTPALRALTAAQIAAIAAAP